MDFVLKLSVDSAVLYLRPLSDQHEIGDKKIDYVLFPAVFEGPDSIEHERKRYLAGIEEMSSEELEEFGGKERLTSESRIQRVLSRDDADYNWDTVLVSPLVFVKLIDEIDHEIWRKEHGFYTEAERIFLFPMNAVG